MQERKPGSFVLTRFALVLTRFALVLTRFALVLMRFALVLMRFAGFDAALVLSLRWFDGHFICDVVSNNRVENGR